MKNENKDERPQTDKTAKLTSSDQEILKAVREVRFGSVEVTIHDARVVQVERREKVRFNTSG